MTPADRTALRDMARVLCGAWESCFYGGLVSFESAVIEDAVQRLRAWIDSAGQEPGSEGEG